MSDEDDLQLLQAKQALQRGDMQAATSILLDAMKYEGKKAAAAYSLGIAYDMDSAFQNTDLAVEYYSIAESLGSDIATYRIAGVQQRSGNFVEAIERFKRISDSNPSAAYWCYRLIKDVNPSDPQVEIFRDKGASQGHVLAKRDILIEGLKGKKGIRRMFTSAFGIVKLFHEIKTAAAEKNEILYQ
ncbi:hypothetical protein NKI56_29245 [Mesorhizobium sp. M0622]|uniref:tetratricopeptide repeat protein n=1 Tax=unclassified Mesorhizobium TaxID=325217 RepID=UPI00333CE0F9